MSLEGEWPEGLDVLHRDDVKTNNHEDTQSENNIEAGRNGSVIGGCGEAKAKAKLTDDIVAMARLRHRHGGGESYAALARDYNVNATTMRRAIIGETWRHLPMPGSK